MASNVFIWFSAHNYDTQPQYFILFFMRPAEIASHFPIFIVWNLKADEK